jgi:hypothetical protein
VTIVRAKRNRLLSVLPHEWAIEVWEGVSG